MALSQGQLNYWRAKTGNPNLTAGQAQQLHNQALAGKKVAGAAPPTTQVPNAPAQPFLNPDQLLTQGQSQLQHDEGVQNYQDQIAQMMLNNKYSSQQIEQGRKKGVAGTQDDAAARGIFHSSIKDGQIFDINAQAATQQQSLADQLNALKLSAQAHITNLDSALTATQNALNQAAVQNASQIDTGYSTVSNPQAGGSGAPVNPQAPTATGGSPQPKPAPYNHNYGQYNAGPFGTYG